MSESNNPLARKALRSSNVSTVVSISLVLFMLGVLGVLVMHASKISDYVRENLELTVVLLADSKEEDVKALKQDLGLCARKPGANGGFVSGFKRRGCESAHRSLAKVGGGKRSPLGN